MLSLSVARSSLLLTTARALATTMPGSIRKVPNEKLYVSEPPPEYFGNGPNAVGDSAWTNGNWLKSRFHFSFAEYRSGPSQFGVLRVMNDDLVQPHRGFGTHPHRDMEIVTYVCTGELTHQDSRGNKETLGRGSIQYMSAGRGIRHSEDNPGDVPVRFIQSWIQPKREGVDPQYGSYDGAKYDRRNKWALLVAGTDHDDDAPVRLVQDVRMYVAELDADAAPLEFPVAPSRQAYLLCVEGEAHLANGATDSSKTLVMHDAAELHGPLPALTVGPAKGASTGCHVLVFEMAKASGGRADAEL